jgi:hypothetical protein
MAAQNPSIPTTSQLDLFTEIWRPVVGYEDLYEVSTQGRVRSFDRLSPHYQAPHQRRKGRLLIPRVKGKGRQAHYQHVALYREGQRHDRTIYRLVLEAFVGLCPPQHVCNHKDGNPANNALDNLEWVTWQRNAQHAVEIGLTINLRGEQHGNARFTTTDVLMMRRLAREGMSFTAIGRQFDTSCSIVSRIVKRQGWAHIPEEHTDATE